MNKLILFILLVTAKCSFAQLPVLAKEPTQFDKFIAKPGIEWAAYISDTVRFFKNNLSEILRNRFDKNEIKASVPVTARTIESNKIIYSKKDEIISHYPSMQGQEPGEYLDSTVSDLVYAAEILYIEKGILKTYIPWISPKFSVITASGLRLGYADYFSSAFNFKYNFSPASHDKIILLEQTKRKLKIDSLSSANMLKELYGKNVAEVLWPYILNDKVDVFSIEGNKKLLANDLHTGIIMEQVPVPVYDSTGILMGNKKVFSEPVLPENIAEVELTQNWLYDETKNIVYSIIPGMILYATPSKGNDDIHMENLPVVKIVFK